MKKVFQNDWFVLIPLLALLTAQTMHTIYVFQAVSHYPQAWFAWCYAIGIEMAILICVARGWLWVSGGYAVATLATNLLYEFAPDSVLSGILLSVLLSVTIAIYSHLFYQNTKRKEAAKESAVTASNGAVTANMIRLMNPYECPACGERKQSAKSLNGHISGHKQKDQWHPDEYPNDWEKQNALNSQELETKINSLPYVG